MARKNQMDLSVGIAMGSCIQIALFVTPVLVLLSGLIAPEPLTLEFSRVEIGALFLGVLIGAHVAGDGRSNWFKGVLLIAFYIILAAMFYLIPAETAAGSPLRDAVWRSVTGRFRLLLLALFLAFGGTAVASGTRAERLVNAILLALVLVAAVLDLRERGATLGRRRPGRGHHPALRRGPERADPVPGLAGGRDDGGVRRARGLASVHRRDAPATAGG